MLSDILYIREHYHYFIELSYKKITIPAARSLQKQ